MSNENLIENTAEYIKELLSGEGTGHDWWHIYRVWRIAGHIAEYEPTADKTIVELGALLHDIADWKFAGGDLEAGPKAARAWLESKSVAEDKIKHIETIIRDTSFKGAGEKLELKTIEAKIIFDADKLDAIGAIGIARTFAYGGNKNREIYNPEQKPTDNMTFEQYSNSSSHTINHFYEKLLLLKDLMQTKTGREMAKRRHEYMKQFLNEFYAEWEGKH